MSQTDTPEEPAGQEVPNEEAPSPAREVSEEEFEHIFTVFHENHEKIMGEIAEVLENNDIGDYRVTGVTFAPRNPPGCHPYVRITDGQVQVGVTCFNS